MYGFRDIFVFAMYYIYGTSGPSLLIESTDSMISGMKITVGHQPKSVDLARLAARFGRVWS